MIIVERESGCFYDKIIRLSIFLIIKKPKESIRKTLRKNKINN